MNEQATLQLAYVHSTTRMRSSTHAYTIQRLKINWLFSPTFIFILDSYVPTKLMGTTRKWIWTVFLFILANFIWAHPQGRKVRKLVSISWVLCYINKVRRLDFPFFGIFFLFLLIWLIQCYFPISGCGHFISNRICWWLSIKVMC